MGLLCHLTSDRVHIDKVFIKDISGCAKGLFQFTER